MAHLVIGTRSEALAVKQASFIKTQIERTQPGLQVGLESLADESADWLGAASQALSSRRVDVIVHHLSELSPRLPEDVHLAAIIERTDARDALLVSETLRPSVHTLADLPAQARVFAQGGHRRAQLAALHPQLAFFEHEISLERALHRLAAQACDAVVADALSLTLLQAEDQISVWLETDQFIPAAGQGALALQSRVEDHRTNLILESLNHTPTRYAVNAERSALRNLYGEPGDAIAITSSLPTSDRLPQLKLTGLVADLTSTPVKIIRATINGDALAPELCGSTLAMELLKTGARELLAHTRTTTAIAFQANHLEALYPAAFEPEVFVEPEATSARNEASPFQGVSEWPTVEITLAEMPATPRLAAFHDTATPEFDLVASKVGKLRQHQPLHTQRILLAATRKQDELAQKLEGLGAAVVPLPRLRAVDPPSWEPLDKVLLHISWYDWLIFSNAASVTACLNRAAELGHHLSEIEARRLCAVGKAAATSMRTAGLSPDLVLPQFTAESLAAEWETRYHQREVLRGKTMLFLTSQALADDFAKGSRSPLHHALDQLGVYVEAVATHHYGLKDWSHEWETAFDYAFFFDAASFDTMATLCAPRLLSEVLAATHVACLSQEAFKAAQAYRLASPTRLTQTHPPAVVKWLREDSARTAMQK